MKHLQQVPWNGSTPTQLLHQLSWIITGDGVSSNSGMLGKIGCKGSLCLSPHWCCDSNTFAALRVSVALEWGEYSLDFIQAHPVFGQFPHYRFWDFNHVCCVLGTRLGTQKKSLLEKNRAQYTGAVGDSVVKRLLKNVDCVC